MLKKLGLVVLAASFLLPVQAKAEQIGVYVAPKFVYGFTNTKGKVSNVTENDTFKTGSLDGMAGGAFALGYDFKPRFDLPVRAELEYNAFGHSKAGKTFQPEDDLTLGLEDKVNVQSLFANVYYDFRNSTALTPYVGAGLGVGFVGNKASATINDEVVSMGRKTSSNFAWNIGLGCSWAFNDYVSVDLGYRYADFGDSKSKTADFQGSTLVGKTGHVSMHQVMMGLRVTF